MISRLRARLDRWLTNPVFLFAAIFLVIASLTRLGLALFNGMQSVPLTLWPSILLRGVWFDLAVLAWLVAPLFLYEVLLPKRVRTSRFHRLARYIGFVFGVFILLFGVVSEFTFWEEFSSRFNFIAVDYLIYTNEVIGNIRESYPVGWLLAGIGLIAALLTWTLRHFIHAADVTQPTARHRVVYVLLALSFPWLSYRFADIDQMSFSANAYANELTGNGLMTLAAAFRRNELDFDRFYRTMPDAQAAKILAELDVARGQTPQTTQADSKQMLASARMPFSKPARNIVLVSVESLSANYLGAFGNTKGITPRLDQLAQEGLLFTRLYATGTRTVRGLEALALGTPPIPGQAIVRRPDNDHLSTVGQILRRQGYETLFLYGGYGYFDNMSAFFSGNDYRVVDRTAFPKPSVVFSNIWGVADESLFDNALSELDRVHAAHKPFLAQIMTTSNHRPYTYPQGRIDIPSPGGRDGAVKYTDYAIGRFIDQAKTKPWFKDTLFVIVADHCASASGKTRLPVPGYHIPMIFYAPDLLKPGRIERVVSQLDVPPTLLDSMGLAGGELFFGQSVFAQNPIAPRAFISNYQELGYYKNDKLIVLGPKKRADTFTIDPQTGEAKPSAMDDRLRDEAVAYYQSASHDFKSGKMKLH